MIEVVAAALVRDGRVLVARRARPIHLAGGWEFPGGKVEPGEDASAALVRECREELGVDVTVGARLARQTGDVIALTLFAASLADGEPLAHDDHDELRWLGADELDALAWLPIDRHLLPSVHMLLRERIRQRRL